jgi:hypothetical protein
MGIVRYSPVAYLPAIQNPKAHAPGVQAAQPQLSPSARAAEFEAFGYQGYQGSQFANSQFTPHQPGGSPYGFPLMGAQAPAAPPRPDWKPIPHINQFDPKGKDASYRNGAFNCAPAVVAMVARGWGKAGTMNDAQLIRNLGHGIVDKNGTTARGVGRMLGRVGVPMAGKALAGRYEDAAVKEHLAKGHQLIAQVRSFDPDSKSRSAHYVLVRGQTHDGNYIVSDPLAKKPYVVTPQQLRNAVNYAPPDGGMLIPVGRPGGDRTPQQAAPTAPMTLEQARQEAWLAQFRPPPPPQPPKPASKVEKNAFCAPKDVFEGENLEFQEHTGKGSSSMAVNEKRNKVSVGVTFRGNKQGELVTKQLTPKHLTPEAYAAKLLTLKAKGDPKADRKLELLESSTFPKDQAVLRIIRSRDLSDGGIGSRTRGTAYGGE